MKQIRNGSLGLLILFFYCASLEGVMTKKSVPPLGTATPSCAAWNSYLTSNFGSQNNYLTGLAVLYCSTFTPPAPSYFSGCNGINDPGQYMQCIAAVAKNLYGVSPNMCKQIACTIQSLAPAGWNCQPSAFGNSAVSGGHVILVCQDANGNMYNIDAQSGTGNFIQFLGSGADANCVNIWGNYCLNAPTAPGCPPIPSPDPPPAQPACFIEPDCGGCGLFTWAGQPGFIPPGNVTATQCNSCGSDASISSIALQVCIKAGCSRVSGISGCQAQ